MGAPPRSAARLEVLARPGLGPEVPVGRAGEAAERAGRGSGRRPSIGEGSVLRVLHSGERPRSRSGEQCDAGDGDTREDESRAPRRASEHERQRDDDDRDADRDGHGDAEPGPRIDATQQDDLQRRGGNHGEDRDQTIADRVLVVAWRTWATPIPTSAASAGASSDT